ncbi:hypothetical protein D3C77_499070 [compost metagenome]
MEATNWDIPAVSIIGITMVPTRITMPRPPAAEKIIEAVTKNRMAIMTGLSPASSAAFRIIDFVMPTLLRICPNQAPNTRPAMAPDSRIEPADKMVLAIEVASGSFDIHGTPAITANRIAMAGKARIVGSFLVIISPTNTRKTTRIPIA